MITISGVTILGTSALLLYFLDPTLTKDHEEWVYFYFVFSILFAQTMDAVDGKHARNTGKASPLGQLIDHGLDIFSYSSQLIILASSQRFGSSWSAFIYQAFCYVRITYVYIYIIL
jgi:phosphatidylglycerophosphate synthase